MTASQKQKGKAVLDLAYKIFVVGGLAGILFSGGVYKEQIEQKTFSTPEIKIKTEGHVVTAPNEVDNYIAYQRLDSLTKDWAKQRVEEKQYRIKQDCLINKNAVTIYQLKESQKKQTEISEQILNKLDKLN